MTPRLGSGLPRAGGRGVTEGLSFGLLAGIILGALEMAAASAMGGSPIMPLRMFASVVLGSTVLQGPVSGSIIGVGIISHLVLSAIFGLVYGLFNARLSEVTQTHLNRQVGLGLLFGALLWFVNFQIIARAIYPWFLGAPQFLQMTLHAVGYGLPLAVMHGWAERRVDHMQGVASPV
jgi:hypothetical protein